LSLRSTLGYRLKSMITAITVLHLVSCVFIILLVLLQSGKGAEVSASFGGSSQTVFGSSGGANFFTKLTWSLAGVFAVTSLLLTLGGSPQGIVEKTLGGSGAIPSQQAPVTPEASTPPAGSTAPATEPVNNEAAPLTPAEPVEAPAGAPAN